MGHRYMMYSTLNQNNATSYAITGKQKLMYAQLIVTASSAAGVAIAFSVQVSKNPAFSIVDGDVNVIAQAQVSVGLVAATVVYGKDNMFCDFSQNPIEFADGERVYLNLSGTDNARGSYCILNFA